MRTQEIIIPNKIRVKAGVEFHIDTWKWPEMCRIVWQAQVLAPAGYEITITSGCDGVGIHKSGSKHFLGKAFDFRIRDFPANASPKIWERRLQNRLGDEYYVEFDEKKVHLHAQWNG